MTMFLAYVLTIFFGGITLWLILHLFTNETPPIVICFISTLLAQLFNLTGILILPFIVIVATLVTIGKVPGGPAFFATVLYSIFETLVIFMVIGMLGSSF